MVGIERFRISSPALIVTAIICAYLLLPGGERFLSAAETDWGGTLQSYIEGGNESDDQLAAGVSAGLWLESRINTDIQFSLAGGYAFNYDKGDIFHYPILNLLALTGKTENSSYRLGRFTMADRNGLLFNALLDGFDSTWTAETDSHRAGFGFTGFVFNRTSRVIMSAVDQKSFDNADPLSLAAPRVVFFYEYSRYFQSETESGSPLDHTMSIGFLGEIDARPEDAVLADSVSSSVLHSAFLQLSVRGLLTRTLLYRANIVGQAGSNQIPGEDRNLLLISGLAEAGITWIPAVTLSPSLSVQILYSTGDKWSQRPDWEGSIYGSGDSLHQYTALTTRTVGYVYAPRIGNLMYARLGGSIRPAEIFSMSLDNYLVFRAVDGPVNAVPVQESDGDSLFLGNEVILSTDLRPFSDFGVNVKAGVFIPNGSLLSNGTIVRFGTTLSVSY